MNLKIYKVILILTSFIFLNGFLVFIPLLGPGLTMATSGNIYKASIQYIVDRHIKSKTGKSSFSYVKERMSKESIKVDLDADLKNLVEKRVKIAHKKLTKQKKGNNLNKDQRNLEEKFNIVKKINYKKINQ